MSDRRHAWIITLKFVNHTLRRGTVDMGTAVYLYMIELIINLAINQIKSMSKHKRDERNSLRADWIPMILKLTMMANQKKMLMKLNQTKKTTMLMNSILKVSLTSAKSAEMILMSQFKLHAPTTSAKNAHCKSPKVATRTATSVTNPTMAYSTKQRSCKKE